MQAIDGSSIINRSGSSTTSPITPRLCNNRNTHSRGVVAPRRRRHNRDGFVVGRRQSDEMRALSSLNKDAIGHNAVEVRVEIEG